MNRRLAGRMVLVLVSMLVLLGPGVARAQWQVASMDGKSSVKFGVLLQPQAEWLETPDAEHVSQNLFLRRARLLVGATINESWSFFLETDSPNLGKAKADGTKTQDFFFQDVIATYSQGDAFKLDMGMMLLPLSHNHQQGAGTLLAVDYGPYTFAESDALFEKVGRDWGAQARGYLLNKHFEYRLGVFQGVRGADVTDDEGDVIEYGAGVEPFRVIGRAVWYPFEADTGFFYTGTTLGAKKILAVGASYDTQRSYETYGVDVFWDQPMGGGNALTVQAGYNRFDGGDFLPTFTKRDTLLVEAGYYFKSVALSPFVQWAEQDFADATADESKTLVGLAYWPSGHKMNVKLGAARFTKNGAPDRNQLVLQCQVFPW